jgi:hypothetical protein
MVVGVCLALSGPWLKCAIRSTSGAVVGAVYDFGIFSFFGALLRLRLLFIQVGDSKCRLLPPLSGTTANLLVHALVSVIMIARAPTFVTKGATPG